MVKTLARSIREFKKPAALTPVLVTVEVILECIIPLIIANLVNQMQAGCGMDVIVRYGIQLLVMAILALVFGVAAGNTCATASTGFARNLRKDMFYCIQDYSFENIDKFSVSSLVTRMTTDVVQENVQAMRVVKSYVRENYEKKKFSAAAEDVCRDFTRAERIMALNNPMMQFCVYAGMAFVLSFGSYVVISGRGAEVAVGQMSAILTYSFQILMSLMTLSMVFVMIAMSMESAERIVEVLTEKSSLTSPEHAVTEVKDGSVDFENVSFKYSQKAKRMALAGVDLHIRSGEVIGVLGGTGSSKTTLVQLIPRLYDVTEGSVKVGGVDVRSYDLEVLRNNVAVVLQKNVLFSGTIKDNLRWGNADATDDEMLEACRLAQADEFIQQFPDKYDTWIEQGGSNVSGGQKQRLCIARALLKKPKVLILDDSTSAVDTRTDALIRQGFREFIPETTKIIIAQRVASVQDADRIIVMDGGRINDIGTHEELMARNEIYREIYTTQNKAGDENGEE